MSSCHEQGTVGHQGNGCTLRNGHGSRRVPGRENLLNSLNRLKEVKKMYRLRPLWKGSVAYPSPTTKTPLGTRFVTDFENVAAAASSDACPLSPPVPPHTHQEPPGVTVGTTSQSIPYAHAHPPPVTTSVVPPAAHSRTDNETEPLRKTTPLKEYTHTTIPRPITQPLNGTGHIVGGL